MGFQLLGAWPAEAGQFVIAVERAGRLIRSARRGIAAGQDLSLASWRLLTLADISRARSQSEIARRLRVSRQAVHAMAHRLQSVGLLAVANAPGNRKSARVLLTPAGGLRLAELQETLWTVLLEVSNDIPREALVAGTHVLNRFSARLRQCRSIHDKRRPWRRRKARRA